MVRRVSLHALAAEQMATSGDADVWLVKISHPAMVEPIRLTTYPVSEFRAPGEIEPTFGVRSTWDGAEESAGPLTYDFVFVDYVPPGDMPGQPHSSQLAIMTVDDQVSKALRSTNEPARVDLAGVKASTPDLAEMQYHRMDLFNSDIQPAQILIDLGRRSADTTPAVAGYFTPNATPGLF